jgi:demethylmenaquinone methyltransferase/2-methoxy-6-polyprenyl-1,4-benzoquinol methylase
MSMESKPTSEAAAAARRLAESFGFERVDPTGKASRVKAVFDSVARSYDLMNDLMSFGAHRLWKEALVDWLAPRPGIRLLDLATGTGDIAERVLDRLDGAGSVLSCDINIPMLGKARDRALDESWFGETAFICADAMSLPFADESVDTVTIAFGIRNVTHVDRALREAYRVLVPGGRFICLEFSKVVLPLFDRFYDAYSFNVLPNLGRVVAGDGESYRYLVESIRRFPDQATFALLIEEAGFGQVRYRNLSGGVAALHSGWRL